MYPQTSVSCESVLKAAWKEEKQFTNLLCYILGVWAVAVCLSLFFTFLLAFVPERVIHY